MKTILLVLSGLVIVGAAGVGWKTSRALNAAEAALVVVAEDGASTEAEIQRVEARIAVAGNEAEQLRGQLDKLQQKKSGQPSVSRTIDSTTSPSSIRAGEQRAAPSREEAKNALAELETLARERLRFANAYRPLFGRLGLSPAQIEAFMAIGSRRFERIKDLNSQTAVAPDDSVIERLKDEAEAAEYSAYRQLLGEAGYQLLQEYDRTTVARDVVGVIAADAVVTGLSYTAAQLEPMVEIVANNSRIFVNNRRNDRPGHYATWKTKEVDWHIVDPQLRPLMSDAQWALYQSQPSTRLNITFEAAVKRAVNADEAAMIPNAAKSGG